MARMRSDLPENATPRDIHQYFQDNARLRGTVLTESGEVYRYQYVSPSRFLYYPEGGEQVEFEVGG